MQIERIGVHESVERIFPPERLRDAIAADGIGQEVVVVGDDVGGVDAVVTLTWDEDWLDQGLSWIQSIQAGVDRFPFDALRERDIVLTNATGVHGDSVGETVATSMLMFARRFHDYLRNQVDHEWAIPAWDGPFTLKDRTVCIVGLGTLGQGVAERAAGLGMHVTGVKRTVENVPHVDHVYPADDLHEAISDAQFVVLACPLTEDTHHLIAGPELERMRDDAYLVNVARGPVVDEGALIAALEAGTVAGAHLDVFEEEPLPADSPLWDRENVIISPHKAGSWEGYYRGVAEIVRENLDRLETGEAFHNRVV